MALPLQLIIGFIFGIVVYWLVENKDKLIFSKGFKKPTPQTPQQPTSALPPGDNVKCSQCGGVIKKDQYLKHLQDVHGIDVKKFYEDLTGTPGGVGG